jgi:hypothetical protein
MTVYALETEALIVFDFDTKRGFRPTHLDENVYTDFKLNVTKTLHRIHP